MSQSSLYSQILSDSVLYGLRRRGFGCVVANFFLSPGFLAAFFYRISSRCRRGNLLLRLFGKILCRLGIVLTSCHISPQAVIGDSFHMPHPTGIVIGQGVTVGKGVSIYQNVTIGRRKTGDEESCADDYPWIGDDVTIFAGAVIAGKLRIGSGAVIGANAVVLEDVGEGQRAAGNPARILAARAEKALGNASKMSGGMA